MDSFHLKSISQILEHLNRRLARTLTKRESEAFSIVRSGIAYEMMDDFITDSSKSTNDIENYIKSVVKEYEDLINAPK